MTVLQPVLTAELHSMSNAEFRLHASIWLDLNLPPHLRIDSTGWRAPTLEKSVCWDARMHGSGLAGMTWPVEYGGHGLTPREHLIANKEIGAVMMPERVGSGGKELAGPIIMAVGTDDQKQAFLPRILTLEDMWCQGFSEPDAGSDLARLRTRAVPHDGGWRINGQKIWTSGASKADYCLLLTRTGTVEDRHKGMLMVAVPMSTPGIRVVAIKSIDGNVSFAEVFFDDVIVPDEARLGAPDEGWDAAIRVLSIERATNRVYRPWRFGTEMRALLRGLKSDPELAVLLDDGAVRDRGGQVLGQTDVLKGFVEGSVEQLLDGAQIGARGSLSKLYWSECHQAFASLALELVAHVTPRSSALAQRMRDHFTTAYLFARAETIYAGTTEVQLDIIAQRILKLSKNLQK